MVDVKRIYPEAKTGLINWVEENFHNIESFIAIFKLSDGTSMTVHHTDSYLEALGLCAMADDTIRQLSANGEFVPSKKNESEV